MKSITRNSKILILLGSFFLLVMAFFHGSGFTFITQTINDSNTDGFLKEIIPVLFVHPSIHLVGLAAFGVLSLSLTQDAKKVLGLLSSLIIIDALLAFYLGGVLPGSLLLVATTCFVLAMVKR